MVIMQHVHVIVPDLLLRRQKDCINNDLYGNFPLHPKPLTPLVQVVQNILSPFRLLKVLWVGQVVDWVILDSVGYGSKNALAVCYHIFNLKTTSRCDPLQVIQVQYIEKPSLVSSHTED